MSPGSALHFPFNIPPELLCKIFTLLSFCDRIGATHVCKYWRDASLDHPGALWSNIRSQGLRPGVLHDQLARTRGVPVDLAVLLKDSTFDEAMFAISSHLHHIHSLHLYTELDEGEVSMENVRSIYEYLTRPAPMLEVLDIVLPIDDTHPDDYDADDETERRLRERTLSFDYTLNADLFAGHAPRLRQAAWLVMELNPNGCATLSRLTRFAFEGRRLSASHMAVIVNCLPHLKCLLIDIDDLEGLPDSPCPDTFKLEELYLDIPSHGSRERGEEDILPVLEYLGYREITRVTTGRFRDWLDCFTARPRGLPRSLHIDNIGLPSFPSTYWHMVNDHGFVSQGHSLQVHDVLATPLGIRLLENLRILVLETSLIIGRVYPPLPRLSHLYLRVRTIPRSGAPASPCLRCPDLQRMEIWWDVNERNCSLGIISNSLAFWLKSVSWTPDPPLQVTVRGIARLPGSLVQPYNLTLSHEPVPQSCTDERMTRWHIRYNTGD
ncbi:hypothetical protein AURDEDRAFT_188392 [Auricularia subglabra TFB-10046 SS5]|uniref:F-box domain-containing protein n=1 Tax=Auricularia subglabra (strain TFB-10046 / SS5) TaxID=717982 RepID=J0WUJ4_AURST|nr:hypothetical protein AURDEDRAFT_188392 [Auricularia subglabra TFB-10046 SS5]